MADLLELLHGPLGDRYRLERTIGQGGMAVVFLAQDLRHHRRVAIKVLKAELATAVGAERFLREVTLAASLDHPHIVPVHDSGEADGLLYYVMPFVDGESLRERLIRERQLRAEDAVQIAREVADALSYAHSRGVVHRDIKPENILLAGGHARVADIGIARAVSAAAGERLTETGVVIGTPAYMSPEQAVGRRELDARSDIFSLGAVLYEMLSGQPPYPGETAHAILARLLTEEPSPLSTMRVPVAPALEAAVLKALAKVPAERFTSAEEFAQAVRLPDPTDRIPRYRRWASIALTVAVVTAGAAWGLRRWSGADEPRMRVSSRPPIQITTTGVAEGPVFAPDGRAITYREPSRPGVGLVIRDLDGGTATIHRSTRVFRAPRWSPSGLRLLFTEFWPPSLSVISRLGGEPGEFQFPKGVFLRGADFGVDDSSFVLALLTRGRGQWLYVGRDPRDIRDVGPDSLAGPGVLVHLTGFTLSGGHVRGRITGFRVSPDRRWVAYVGVAGRDSGAVFVGTIALDGRGGSVVAEDSGNLRALENGAMQPSWSPTSDWIYYARQVGSETTILRVQIDPGSGRRSRGPEIVLDRLPQNLHFDVAPDGKRLVYSAGPRRASLYALSWGGNGSPEEPLVRGTSNYGVGVIAPDGRAVAYVKAQTFEGVFIPGDLYVRSLPDGLERRVAREAQPPIGWSPDGTRLAYFSSRLGMGLMLVDVETGRSRRIGTRWGHPRAGLSWSPDGRRVVYESNAAVVLQDTAGGAVEIPARLPDPAALVHPVFAPDGRRLAMLLPEGLSIHDIETGRTSLVTSESLMPLGWTADGWIYATRSPRDTSVRLERILPTGGPSRIVLDSPDLRACYDVALARGGNAVVCTKVELATDIWLKDLAPGR